MKTTLVPASGLHRLLAFLIAFTAILAWLPLVRCTLDGRTYSWGQSWFGIDLYSEGLTVDVLFLVVQTIFYAVLLFSLFWSANRPLVYGLLGLWWLNFFGNFLLMLWQEGDVIFEGDTLGVKVSLLALLLPLSALALLLIILVIRRERRPAEAPIAWGRANRLWLWLLVGLLPIQALLLATGEPHGTTDAVGVILTILQTLVSPLIVLPRRMAG